MIRIFPSRGIALGAAAYGVHAVDQRIGSVAHTKTVMLGTIRLLRPRHRAGWASSNRLLRPQHSAGIGRDDRFLLAKNGAVVGQITNRRLYSSEFNTQLHATHGAGDYLHWPVLEILDVEHGLALRASDLFTL